MQNSLLKTVGTITRRVFEEPIRVQLFLAQHEYIMTLYFALINDKIVLFRTLFRAIKYFKIETNIDFANIVFINPAFQEIAVLQC